MKDLSCRLCSDKLSETFADLGMSPLSNSYIKPEKLQTKEVFYPLHAYVCGNCFLVQLEEFESPDHIFSDYAYFSSNSESWLRHAESYCVQMIEKYGINAKSQVVEIASNDGYLLQYFKARGIPVLGVEPAANVAEVAIKRGIPSKTVFFGTNTAKQLLKEGFAADLLLGNNVFAHVPNLRDFVGGLKVLLKPGGMITLEFPHLLNLIRLNQFDTIYHEHFSYLSLLAVERAFEMHGLSAFHVETLATHGGSLRVFAKHADDRQKPVTAGLLAVRDAEREAGLGELRSYRDFSKRIQGVKWDLLEFLIGARRAGKKVVGYGAPAKGNTLLNYCGIRTDFLDYTVDLSPHKQGLYLPGTHIPILRPDDIKASRPDYVLILPWNLREEIVAQMGGIRDWGGKFVVPIPRLEVF